MSATNHLYKSIQFALNRSQTPPRKPNVTTGASGMMRWPSKPLIQELAGCTSGAVSMLENV
jgi:hypothetical protein